MMETLTYQFISPNSYWVWLLIAFGWLILSYMGHLIVSGVALNWNVAAKYLKMTEFPSALVSEGIRLVRFPLFWGFIGLFILFIPFEQALVNAQNPSSVGNFLYFIVRLTAGFLITGSFILTSMRVASHIEREYTGRKFAAYGSYSKRNLSTLLFHLAKPILALIGLGLLLWLLGLDVSGFLVTFGSLTVAIGFAMQHVLANILAGISLAIDTPFSKNDLIRIGDDPQIYQVLKRGLRVTTVKNISSHETVFLPNKDMTEKKLIDVTRPTDDLRAVIDVKVPFDQNLRDVRAILSDVANGHPHIIGSLPVKQKSIEAKISKLFIRGVYADCVAHFVELARLKSESKLNDSVASLIRKLENWADFVDQNEGTGLNEVNDFLLAISEELTSLVDRVGVLTTEWQILFRNSTASYKPSGAAFPIFDEVSEKIIPGSIDPDGRDVEAVIEALYEFDPALDLKKPEGFKTKANQVLTARFEWLKSAMTALSENSFDIIGKAKLAKGRERNFGVFNAEFRPLDLEDERWENLATSINNERFLHTVRVNTFELRGILEGNKNWIFVNNETTIEQGYRNFHLLLATAHKLSKLSGILPRNSQNGEEYDKDENGDGYVRAFSEIYLDLGRRYVELLQESAKWIAGEEEIRRNFVKTAFEQELSGYFEKSAEDIRGFNIVLCRNRKEDLFISNRAGDHIMNHPICSAFSGLIIDDDEQRDVFFSFQIWGDKLHQLFGQMSEIRKALRDQKSLTIDTKLRDLARWLKEEFKDPNPSWKYPIAPVENFDEFSIHMTMKVYVDNVRMERYLRPYNTYTQLRLRIVERLENAGISIPVPRRDINISSVSLKDSPKLPK